MDKFSVVFLFKKNYFVAASHLLEADKKSNGKIIILTRDPPRHAVSLTH